MGAIQIISASAGSGKTHTLASRLSDAIRSGGVRPEAVLATSFTNRAAAELQQRVRTHLMRAGLVDEAQRLLGARFGTVHAVCGRLLGEFSFELGLSPMLQVAAEQRAARVLRQALDAVLDDAERERIDALGQRWELLARQQAGGSGWMDALQELIDLVRANRLDPAALADCAARSSRGLAGFLDPPGDAAQLERALLAAIVALGPAAAAAGDKTKLTQKLLDLAAAAERRLAVGRPLAWNDWVKLAIGTCAKKSDDLAEPLRQAAAAHLAHPLLRDDVRQIPALLLDLTARAIHAYAAHKRERGLIDFTDQEVHALALLERRDVQQRLQGQIDLVLVDEFQDTSPIELAIFLRLAALAGRSIWVGDQKQSIYAFRGTDPALMDATMQAVEAGTPSESLEHSFRSRPGLVQLTSALFAPAFAAQGIPEQRVRLQPAVETEPPGLGPVLERWYTQSKGNNRRLLADQLAAGVEQLLAEPALRVRRRDEPAARPARPADLAVLCRSNKACDQVVAALEQRGIRAARPRAGLLATHEGRLLLAGLRLWIDPHDRLARAELLRLLRHPDDPDRFLAEILAAADTPADQTATDPSAATGQPADRNATDPSAAPGQPADQTATDPSAATGQPADRTSAAPPAASETPDQRPAAEAPATAQAPAEIAPLLAARRRHPGAGALAALELVAEALDAREHCLAWGRAHARLANLDAVHELAASYTESGATLPAAPNPAGLLAHLQQLAADGADHQAAAEDPEAVVVLTWHKAKGQEWPLVVLHDIDLQRPGDPFGPTIVTERDSIDLADPLAGRWLRYWPRPYHPQRQQAELLDRVNASPAAEQARQHASRENLRLLYVIWTRARDRLILAAPHDKLTSGPLKLLQTDDHQLQDPAPPDQATAAPEQAKVNIELTWSDHPFELTLRNLTQLPAPTTQPPEPQAAAAYPSPGPQDHPPAWLQPSTISPQAPAATAQDTPAPQITTPETIGQRIPLTTKPDMTDLGHAVHSFLAADRPDYGAEDRSAMATKLLQRWAVHTALTPEALVQASNELHTWADKNWPNATWHREMPLQHRQANGTIVRGTCDLALETESGWIIIDHKTFPGTQREALTKAQQFIPQLTAYATAVQRATGAPVLGTYLYLPIMGVIMKVNKQ